jgi:hypothetical protein
MPALVEITEQPGGAQGVALSKNPYRIKVIAPGMITTEGVYYSREWEVDKAGENGDSFDFGGDYPTNINVSATPSSEGGDILAYTESGSSSKNEWVVECVLPVLNAHYIYGNYWQWTANGVRLIATAREYYVPDKTIVLSTTGVLTLIDLSTTSGVPAVTTPNNRVTMVVHCTTGMGTGVYKTSEVLTYDLKLNAAGNAGEVDVDLSTVVDSMIDGWDTLTNLDAGGNRLEVMQRRVFVNVKGYINSELSRNITTKALTVLKGGMRTNELPAGYLPWVGSNATNPIGYITNKPKAVWCTKQTKLYLCWHNKWMDSDDSTVLKVEVYYASGTSAGDTMATINNATKGKYEVWGRAAGFNDLNLDSLQPGAAVVKWEIITEHADPANAIKQTYYLLPETDMGCTLVYRNAFGVPDSIWCEGERTTAAEHTKELIDVGRGLAPTVYTVREKSYGRSLKPRIVLTTAPMKREEWTSALDVLLSDEVRIHFPQTDTWVVGQIEPGTVEETTVNWAGSNMVAMRIAVRLNEEAGWSTQTFKQ